MGACPDSTAVWILLVTAERILGPVNCLGLNLRSMAPGASMCVLQIEVTVTPPPSMTAVQTERVTCRGFSGQGWQKASYAFIRDEAASLFFLQLGPICFRLLDNSFFSLRTPLPLL